MQEKEKPRPKQNPNESERHFHAIDVGDWVLYWITGTRVDYACPALVTMVHEPSRSLDLTVFARDGRNVLKVENGVRHIDDPDYPVPQRKEVGAWEPTKTFLRNLALVSHDD